MILQKLIEHSKTLEMPPPFYAPNTIKYVFDLDGKGRLTETSVFDGGREQNDRGKSYNLPTQSNQKGAKLLFGNAEFVCGIPKDDEITKDKVEKKHNEFLQLLRECANETENPSISAITEFYQNTDYKARFLQDEFDPTMNISFRINGEFPFEQADIQDFWKQRNSAEETKTDVKCHLCGRNPATERMPSKIKGGRIPDGQTAGMLIISANVNAFESYGLKASKTSPTCSDCSEKFTCTLNHLLADEDSNLTVGKQVYAFWTKGEDFSPVKALQNKDNEFFNNLPDLGDETDPAIVKNMFKSAFGGKESAIDNQEDRFYAAAFSATGGRVVIRDWLETTIPKAKENLVEYFANCYTKYQSYPHGVFALASSTVFKAIPANTFTKLLNTALKGDRLPEDLLYKAVNRARVEKKPITHPRASLIKLYFLTNKKHKEIKMAQLDKSTKKPAYLCGRLMAVLEEIQAGALGTTNATIVDRYYGTASTAPATVFSSLLSGSRHHLAKLRKQKPGYYTNLEKKLQEVVSDLSEFPKVLSLEEQGLFALGYYHQKQERFQKQERKEEE